MNIEVIDSHTGGEPTRVVIGGMPGLRGATVAEQLTDFRENYDHLRRGIVCEPRGSDVMVGALLCPTNHPDCECGVIFFNNVGFLGMCGHGTIGVVETLANMKRLKGPEVRIETPVGVVGAHYDQQGSVTIENVPSYRMRPDVRVEVPNLGWVEGDVAWGGNWFFLVKATSSPVPSLEVTNAVELTHITNEIKNALIRAGIYGADGAMIDHIELFSEGDGVRSDSRNFVLCPGNAYDRSPCGTGTSAKMACLYESGKLKAGQIWRQASITGSIFNGWLETRDEDLIPYIRGRAFISGKSTLVFDSSDPFVWGIS
jgi:4-hydroxyproline epimerase